MTVVLCDRCTRRFITFDTEPSELVCPHCKAALWPSAGEPAQASERQGLA